MRFHVPTILGLFYNGGVNHQKQRTLLWYYKLYKRYAILIKKHKLFCDNQEGLILEDSNELGEGIHRKGAAPH